jgi:hypothetical protein
MSFRSFRSLARLAPLAAVPLFASIAAAGPAPSASASAKASAAPKASASASGSAKPADPGGKLNREEFETALRPHLMAMNDCYRKALKKDAIAEGDVILVLETQGGKIIKADTDRAVSTMKLEDAHKCIVAVIKKMKPPVAKNSDGKYDPKLKAVVRYPVEFTLGIDVGAGPSKATGAKLDHDKVKNVFFVNKIEFGRCILDARKAMKGEKAAGKLVLKVGVTGGKVTTVEPMSPETTVEDKEFKDCVTDAVKKFKFPLAKDSKGNDDEKAASTIVYPMEFTM